MMAGFGMFQSCIFLLAFLHVFLPTTNQVHALATFPKQSTTWADKADKFYAQAVTTFHAVREKLQQGELFNLRLLSHLVSPEKPPTWKEKLATSLKNCFSSAAKAVKDDTCSLYRKVKASLGSTRKQVWEEFQSLPRCVKSWFVNQVYTVSCSLSKPTKADWIAWFRAKTNTLAEGFQSIAGTMMEASKQVYNGLMSTSWDFNLVSSNFRSLSCWQYFDTLIAAIVGDQDVAAEVEAVEEDIGQLETSLQQVTRHFQTLATFIQDLLSEFENPDGDEMKEKLVHSYKQLCWILTG